MKKHIKNIHNKKEMSGIMNLKIDRPKSLYLMLVSGTLVFTFLVAIIALNQVYYEKATNTDDYFEEIYILVYNVTSQVWWGVTTLITFLIFILSMLSYIDTLKKQYIYYIEKANKTKK